MKITFEQAELKEFARRLGRWFLARDAYVIDRIGRVPDPHYLVVFQAGMRDQIAHLRKEFEKENPCPDWRSLL